MTATRTKKRDLDVPAATTIITAQEIKDSGAANASDVLAKVDGFAYKSFGPNGAAMGSMTNEVNLRGIKGGALVLMNGNPIAWRGKYNLDQIPASSIERIEIVKGSGSVLYGSEAVSGVVNIITKKKGTNEVHVGLGNYGQRSYGVSVGDEKFGFYYNYDKWGNRDGLNYASASTARFRGETRLDVSNIIRQNIGLSYQVNPRLNFLFGYYETEGKYTSEVSQARGGTSGLRVGNVIQARKYETKQYITQLNYQDANWKGSLFYNTGNLAYEGPTYITRSWQRRNSWYHTREKNSSYGMDVQRTWKMGPKSTAILGFDLVHEMYAVIPTSYRASNERYSRNNWGIFGQWEQRFDKRNTGIFGLRGTWTTGAARSQNYSNLSASGQWLHKLDRENSLYLNISQSFVMPTFAQMYNDNASQLPSPNLRPQKGINYEIGWKQNHDRHTWKAAIFHIRVKDNITPHIDDLTNPVRYYTNEEMRNVGVELSHEIRGANGFSYNWGVTWQNPMTKNTENNLGWVRTFGKVQLTGGVNYHKGKLTSALTASYLADRVQTPNSKPAFRSKPYLLTTWNTAYAPDEHSEINLRIDNVLNRDDTAGHSGTKYYVAPFNFLLSYSYKF